MLFQNSYIPRIILKLLYQYFQSFFTYTDFNPHSHAEYRNFKITVLNYSLISIRTPAQGETTTVLITMVFQSTHESTKPKS